MADTLRIGGRGTDVQTLQRLLNKRLKGGPVLRVDGTYGRQTYRAVQRFQAQRNLGIDGVVGPKTWQALNMVGQPINPPQTPVALTPAAASDAHWMPIAIAEIGQKEESGSQHNPRIIEYHSTTALHASADETAWCSSFVNWCMKQAGIQGTHSAAATSWMSWGKASPPKYGAVIVIYNATMANSSLSASGNHVGFLISETPTYYDILGGNQGNKVKRSNYPKSSW